MILPDFDYPQSIFEKVFKQSINKEYWCYPLYRIQRMIVDDKLYFHVDILKKGMLRAEITAARRQLMEEAEKYYSDKFVTGKELTKLYLCFTKSWLSSYGCHLPRTRATIYDDDENEQNSQWGYSLNGIKRCIERGYVQCHGKRYFFNKDNTGFSV